MGRPPRTTRAQADPDRTLLIPPWHEHVSEPWLITRAILWLGARFEVRRWLIWARPVGWLIASLDRRVRLHKRYYKTAILLDRRIHGPDKLGLAEIEQRVADEIAKLKRGE